MRKLVIGFTIFTLLFLSGCSVLQEVNDSLDYANKAKEHINMLNSFGQEAPGLMKDAVSNPEAKEELEVKIDTLLVDIEEFNNIQPPSIAEGVHEQIVEKNNSVVNAIESTKANGELAVEKLQNSQVLKLINEVSSLMDSIEKLGQ